MLPTTPMTTSNTGADPVDVTPRDSDLNARDKMVTGAPHHVSPRTAPTSRCLNPRANGAWQM